MSNTLINQRVDTEEFGRITGDVFWPKSDGSGNWVSGQIKLHDLFWSVEITDTREDGERVWTCTGSTREGHEENQKTQEVPTDDR